jgi:transcription elongation factor Elf1
LGRRRRRVVRIIKKKLPTVFVCPRCGEEAVRVTIAKDTGHATVLCALCNLKDDFPAHPAAQAIDVYSYFTDRFYGVKDPRPIIPRDREYQRIPSEEEAEEETATLPTSEAEAQPSRLEIRNEKLETEPRPLTQEVPPTEMTDQRSAENSPVEETTVTDQETSSEPQAESPLESEKEPEEDKEPFADIMENKDKKRYSSTPLPQSTSEQTS